MNGNCLTVGVADCRISNDPAAELVTYALGSCIAVVIYDPVVRVGGLLHFMLPDSRLNGSQADLNPHMFADTGIPRLFRGAYEKGAAKSRLLVRLAGGARVLDENGAFDIGRRNYLASRRLLWAAGVLVHGEAVGGTSPRTVRLHVGTGDVRLRSNGSAERDFPVSPQHTGRL